ncbi:MAG: MazG family protein [Clostridia bacterium]|nr:MazG family protein [Clostridia bacterium]
MNEKAKELTGKARYTIADLLSIMELLRAEDGCPWDKEQTHESIRSNLIEETYEVVEAIDTADSALLREELGDVLLQVVFHARISEEAGDFTFDDVCDEVARKLVIRHPHIFADVEADTTDKVLANWDAIKAETKHRDTLADTLNSVPRTLPSLMRAAKIAKKAAKAGYGKPLDHVVGDLLLDIATLCNENGIDPEKALYDACDRRILDVVAREDADEN